MAVERTLAMKLGIYFSDEFMTRLPTHLNSRIDELLPHRWQPSA